MKTSFTLLLLVLLTCTYTYAQNFEYGKFTQEELDMKIYAKDSTADAVVLREFGSANIDLDNYTNESYVNFIYHTRIANALVVIRRVSLHQRIEEGTVHIESASIIYPFQS